MILQLLFPPKCVLCGKLLKREMLDLCHACRASAPHFCGRRKKRRYIRDWTALWYYEDMVRESLLRYKFSGRRSYALAYGRMLAMRIQQDLTESFDVLTWAPVSRRRKHKRGYDQAELLTRAVARELDKPVVRLLRKTRNNPAQSSMEDEAQRRANVLGVYQAVSPFPAVGKRVLLLDDIITTGSTAEECARVLLTAGAEAVFCAAIAVRRAGKEQSKTVGEDYAIVFK